MRNLEVFKGLALTENFLFAGLAASPLDQLLNVDFTTVLYLSRLQRIYLQKL